MNGSQRERCCRNSCVVALPEMFLMVPIGEVTPLTRRWPYKRLTRCWPYKRSNLARIVTAPNIIPGAFIVTIFGYLACGPGATTPKYIVVQSGFPSSLRDVEGANSPWRRNLRPAGCAWESDSD